MMDRATAKQIMQEAQVAMDAVFAAHGLKTGKISGSFDGGSITVRIVGEGTGLDSPKIQDWNRYAESYGLPKDALGVHVTLNRKQYEITGLAPSRRKFPVCVTEIGTGKEMLFTVPAVKRALGLPVSEWER